MFVSRFKIICHKHQSCSVSEFKITFVRGITILICCWIKKYFFVVVRVVLLITKQIIITKKQIKYKINCW